eukprot:gene9662-20090_t
MQWLPDYQSSTKQENNARQWGTEDVLFTGLSVDDRFNCNYDGINQRYNAADTACFKLENNPSAANTQALPDVFRQLDESRAEIVHMQGHIAMMTAALSQLDAYKVQCQIANDEAIMSRNELQNAKNYIASQDHEIESLRRDVLYFKSGMESATKSPESKNEIQKLNNEIANYQHLQAQYSIETARMSKELELALADRKMAHSSSNNGMDMRLDELRSELLKCTSMHQIECASMQAELEGAVRRMLEKEKLLSNSQNEVIKLRQELSELANKSNENERNVSVTQADKQKLLEEHTYSSVRVKELEKALEALKISTRIELENTSTKYIGAETEVGKLRESLVDATRKITEMEYQLSTVDGERNRLHNELQHAQDTVKDLEKTIEIAKGSLQSELQSAVSHHMEASTEASMARQELSDAKAKIKELEQYLSAADDDRLKLHKDMNDTSNRMTVITNELEANKASHKVELECINQRCITAENEVKHLRPALHEMHNDNKALEETLHNCQNDNKYLLEQLSSVQQREQELTAENSSLQEKLSDVNSSKIETENVCASSQSEINKLKQTINELLIQVQELQLTIKKQTSSYEIDMNNESAKLLELEMKLKEEISDLINCNHDLNDKYSVLQTEYTASASQYDASVDRIQQLEISLEVTKNQAKEELDVATTRGYELEAQVNSLKKELEGMCNKHIELENTSKILNDDNKGLMQELNDDRIKYEELENAQRILLAENQRLSHELDDMCIKQSDLENTHSLLNDERSRLVQELDEFRVESSVRTSELENLTEKTMSSSSELEKSKADLVDAFSTITHLRQEIKDFSLQNDDLENQLTICRDENIRLNEELLVSHSQLNDMNATTETLQNELSTLRKDTAMTMCALKERQEFLQSASKAEISNLEDQIEANKVAAADSLRTIEELKTEISNLKEQLEVSVNTIHEFENTTVTLQKEIEDLKLELDCTKCSYEEKSNRINELEIEQESYLGNIQTLNDTISLLNDDINNLSSMLQQKETEIECLTSNIKQVTTDLETQCTESENLRQDLVNVEHKLNETEKELNNTNNDLFVLCKALEDQQISNRKLKEESILTSAEMENVLLQTKTELKDTTTRCTDMRNFIDNLEGEISKLKRDNVEVTSIAKERQKAFETSSKTEYAQLQTQLEKTQRKLSDADTMINTLREERDVLTTDLVKSASKIVLLESSFTDSEQDKDVLRQHLDKFVERTTHLEHDKTSLKSEVQSLQSELQTLRPQYESFRNESSRLQSVLKDTEKKLDETQSHLRSAHAEISHKTSDLEIASKRVFQSETATESLKSKLDQCRNELSQTQDKFDKASNKIIDLQGLLESRKNEIEGMNIKTQSMNEKIQGLVQTLCMRDGELEVLKADKARLNSNLDKATEELVARTSETSRYKEEVEKVTTTKHEKEEELKTTTKDLMLLCSALEEAEKSNRKHQEELITTKGNLDKTHMKELELNAEIDRLRQGLAEESRKLKSKEQQLATLEADRENLRQEVKDSTTKLSKAEMTLSILKSEGNNALSLAKETHDSLEASCKAEISYLKSNLDKAVSRATEAEALSSALKTEIEHLMKDSSSRGSKAEMALSIVKSESALAISESKAEIESLKCEIDQFIANAAESASLVSSLRSEVEVLYEELLASSNKLKELECTATATEMDTELFRRHLDMSVARSTQLEQELQSVTAQYHQLSAELEAAQTEIYQLRSYFQDTNEVGYGNQDEYGSGVVPKADI